MSFELQIEEMPGYLAARLIGDWAAEDIWGQFEFFVERCKLTKHDKLLIDGRGSPMTLSGLDAFFLGEKSQIFIKNRIKAVGVGKPERADLHRFAKLVAQNRGIRLRVFTDVQSAEEWLLSE